MGTVINLEPRRSRKRRLNLFLWLLLLFFILVIIAAGYLYYFFYWPNSQKISPYPNRPHPIWVGDTLWEGKGPYVKDGKVWLPYSFIREKIDPYLYWDESIDSLILTTEKKVLRLPNQQVTAFLNEKTFPLTFPVEKIDGEPFLPMEVAEKFYPYSFSYQPETGVLLIKPWGYVVQTGTILGNPEKDKGKPLRSGPSIKEPLYLLLSPGEKVEILGEEKGWYEVRTGKGIVGYMEKKDLFLSGMEKVPEGEREEDYRPWNPVGKPILLTWEHVVRNTPDPSTIGNLAGVNVVAPTWFEIIDEKGTVQNLGDLTYSKWAHERGYQVWGLISNGFDPDRTQAFLSNFETRQRILRQMLQLASIYNLDGFNIDFENVYLKDREVLVQFIREITPYLHEQNLTVSIDVTIKSESETWSKFYDRKALGETADYVVVMTYDEHWAGSPIAGSVASLPWVEMGLKGVLEEVPPEKVLLGVPFYTRLWSESKGTDGKLVVKQRALSMEQAENWMKERKLTPVYDEASGQQYVEYKDPMTGTVYKMWLEDAGSIKKRAELVKKYNLAGLAAWRRGFEKPEAWAAIQEAWAR
ncbi:glycosyl hydrolase family 18 protein [Thermicanus aegyptius]|uniref:glycosyl hydrolase family 18 protein n=1 Tax=Thermicanus aegyptius TaxID=94009 RepID=UPI000407A1ED|nr:glycosyl hydrolase family 18 protein [Thermicanus aegyptius]